MADTPYANLTAHDAAINQIIRDKTAADRISNTADAEARRKLAATVFANKSAVGTLASLTTTDKTDAVSAVNELDGEIGTLASLTTTDKTNIVSAVNELDGEIGTLTSLTTTATGDLVSAINELDTDLGTAESSIGTIGDLETGDSDLVAAVNRTYNIAGASTMLPALPETEAAWIMPANFDVDAFNAEVATWPAQITGGTAYYNVTATVAGSTTIRNTTESTGNFVSAAKYQNLSWFKFTNDGSARHEMVYIRHNGSVQRLFTGTHYKLSFLHTFGPNVDWAADATLMNELNRPSIIAFHTLADSGESLPGWALNIFVENELYNVSIIGDDADPTTLTSGWTPSLGRNTLTDGRWYVNTATSVPVRPGVVNFFELDVMFQSLADAWGESGAGWVRLRINGQEEVVEEDITNCFVNSDSGTENAARHPQIGFDDKRKDAYDTSEYRHTEILSMFANVRFETVDTRAAP